MEGLVGNAGFWRGRRVFLTGHTGFKGAWLSLILQALGVELTGYALAPPSDPSLFELARVAEGMRSHHGDVRDLAGLRAVMADARPEVVIHMAAQSLVRPSYRDPVETYATNVMGTVHVLEAARQVPGVRAVLNVTSDKCYDNREGERGYVEDDAMGGKDPYSSSKGCAELVTAAYRHAFFRGGSGPAEHVRLASARAGNVIGGGDWAAERLVPDLCRAQQAGRPVVLRNPGAVRPWQHVLEPLHGYLLLVERLAGAEGAAFAEGWNFGPDAEDARPVHWIAEQLAAQWGQEPAWLPDERPAPHEAHSLRLDSAKARARLGWRPRWALPHALETIGAWWTAFRDGADMRNMTLAQARSYGEAA